MNIEVDSERNEVKRRIYFF